MKKRGFTIIEVVLVLAIAGLIFLMVFIALPALQRSQRDTQRKNDVARINTAIQDYISKNNKLPFGLTSNGNNVTVWYDDRFVSRYVDSNCTYDRTSGAGGSGNFVDYWYKGCGSEFTSPDGNIYRFAVFKGFKNNKKIFTGWDNADYYRIYVMSGAKCGDDENTAIKTDNPKDYVIAIKLEGKAVYCESNT